MILTVLGFSPAPPPCKLIPKMSACERSIGAGKLYLPCTQLPKPRFQFSCTAWPTRPGANARLPDDPVSDSTTQFVRDSASIRTVPCQPGAHEDAPPRYRAVKSRRLPIKPKNAPLQGYPLGGPRADSLSNTLASLVHRSRPGALW